jgi:protein-S-isoprenylcysteine O-methyltransferase Ste14
MSVHGNSAGPRSAGSSFCAVSGPWDAPPRVVAVGPYRWVRNPIYVAALLIVLGEAWLFMANADTLGLHRHR